MTRGLALGIAVALLCAGGATACFLRMRDLRSEGSWLLAYGGAQAEIYARSFDGAAADAEFSSFDQRRQVLERATAWQRGGMVLLLASVTAALCSYLLFLIQRLKAQLTEIASGEALSSDVLPVPPDRSKHLPQRF